MASKKTSRKARPNASKSKQSKPRKAPTKAARGNAKKPESRRGRAGESPASTRRKLGGRLQSAATFERESNGSFVVRLSSGELLATPKGAVVRVDSESFATALAETIGGATSVDVSSLSLVSMAATLNDFVVGSEQAQRESCVHTALHELAALARSSAIPAPLRRIVARALGPKYVALLESYRDVAHGDHPCKEAPADMRASLTTCLAGLDAWQLTVAVNAAHNDAFTLAGAFASRISLGDLQDAIGAWRQISSQDSWGRPRPAPQRSASAGAAVLHTFAHRAAAASPPAVRIGATRSAVELLEKLAKSAEPKRIEIGACCGTNVTLRYVEPSDHPAIEFGRFLLGCDPDLSSIGASFVIDCVVADGRKRFTIQARSFVDAEASAGALVAAPVDVPLSRPILGTRTASVLRSRLRALAAMSDGASLATIAEESGLAEQDIRSLLRRHKAAGEIAGERQPASMGPYGLPHPPWMKYQLTSPGVKTLRAAVEAWKKEPSFDPRLATVLAQTRA